MFKKTSKTTILNIFSILSVVFFIYAVYNQIFDSLWRDEAFTGLLMNGGLREVVSAMIGDNNPPLHPIIVLFFSKLFGNHEVVLRLPSLLGVVGTVCILRMMLQDSKMKSLVTILFFLNPSVYYFATEVRYYGVLMFVYMLSFYYSQQLRNNPNVKNKFWWIFTNILLFYTHTVAIFAFVTNVLIVLCCPDKKRSIKKLIKKHLFLGIPLLLFVPWMIVLLQQYLLRSSTGYWVKFDPLKDLWEVLYIFAYTGIFYLPHVRSALERVIAEVSIYCTTIPMFGLFLYSIRRVVSIKKYLLLIPLIAIVFIYSISFVFPLFLVRYLIFLLPICVMILAYGCKSLISRMKKIGLLLCLGIVYLMYMNFYFQFYSSTQKPQYREAGEFISTNSGNDFIVLNDSEFSYYPCLYYTKNCYIAKYPDVINVNIGNYLVSEDSFIRPGQSIDTQQVFILGWDEGHILSLEDKYNLVEIQEYERKGEGNLLVYEYSK